MIFDKEIYGLIQNIEKPLQPLNIDIVLEGGGFNGSYELGILLFLRKLEREKYIKINRFSGASIGAILSLAYLSNNLEKQINYYSHVRESWRENMTLEKIHENIYSMCYNIDDELFDFLKKDKLYITYHNINTKEQIVQSEFKNRNDLYESLIKTSYLPFLMDKNLCYNSEKDIDYREKNKYVERNNKNYEKIERNNQNNKNNINNKNNENNRNIDFDFSNNFYNCREKNEKIERNNSNEQFFIDGGQPFIFHNREKSLYNKILYIHINGISIFKNMFSTKNEKNPYGRILYGIIDCYEFFKTKKKTKFCSFVNEWNSIDFLFLRIKQLFLLIIVYCINYLKKSYSIFEPYLKNNDLFKVLKPIFKNLYCDFLLNNCF